MNVMLANQPPLSPSEVYSGVTTPQLGARGRLFLAKPEIQEAGITLDDLYQTVRDQYESTGLQAKRFDLLAKIFTDFARSYDLAPDDFAAALNISVAEANALLAGPDARTVQLQQLWAQTVSASQSTMLRNALQVAANVLFINMREIGTSAAELAAANGITVAAVNEFLDIAKQYVFDDFTLPSDWYDYTPAQKAAWFNQSNVTPTQLRAAGVPDEDMAYLRQVGYTIQDAGSAAPVEPVQVVVEDQSRGIDATTVVTAPPAPSDAVLTEPEIIYDIPFPDVSIREIPTTTPPVETPAPATGVTAVEKYVFGDITLPQGWYQFTPAQKANWFNQNNVTPKRLRAEGVSDEDIKYLRQAGYTIQDATTVAPVSPVAPAAGNLLPLALAAAFVLFGG